MENYNEIRQYDENNKLIHYKDSYGYESWREYDERNTISVHEGYVTRCLRRQKRFLRFITQYPSEVIWGPYFSIKQRLWRMAHGWR